MKKVLAVLTLLVAALALSVAPAAAQGGLDPAAEPNYGTVTLSAGFMPDPFIFPIVSGGSEDISALNLAEGCRGYATAQPDFRIEFSGQAEAIRIFFVSDGDTTLTINNPAGEWLCNDDSTSLSPMVELAAPAEGTYNVWVGSYSNEVFNPGYLFITAFESDPTHIISTVGELNFVGVDETAGSTGAAGSLDATAAPLFGTSNLAANFSPDPMPVVIEAGGPVDTSSMNLGELCRGNVTAEPTYRINWTGTAANLRVFFASEGDGTMIIQQPDGSYLCNDDDMDNSVSLNPLVDIANPVAGEYSIWVGNLFLTDALPGTLYISQGTTANPATVE